MSRRCFSRAITSWPSPDNDLGEQLEPVALLVRDQDPQMLEIAPDHSGSTTLPRRATETGESE